MNGTSVRKDIRRAKRGGPFVEKRKAEICMQEQGEGMKREGGERRAVKSRRTLGISIRIWGVFVFWWLSQHPYVIPLLFSLLSSACPHTSVSNRGMLLSRAFGAVCAIAFSSSFLSTISFLVHCTGNSISLIRALRHVLFDASSALSTCGPPSFRILQIIITYCASY
ncbi:hypothetical protein B0J12DRAFT_686182 [Macrophomina phaseolina]|uniref:Uncharacterized protein n=1 Tax=Macrophomina phaseolina TaxID=35725 RepID=A0ABQ8FTD3_9PEZI|nr:hypothetical protein B0J12DRAFT_686182 [Macrophomina phaseolina]